MLLVVLKLNIYHTKIRHLQIPRKYKILIKNNCLYKKNYLNCFKKLNKPHIKYLIIVKKYILLKYTFVFKIRKKIYIIQDIYLKDIDIQI